MPTRRSFAMLSAAALALSITATAAARQWPSGDVNYIIPFNPGGESDVTARFQQKYFEDVTGHRLMIQYQAGAGGGQAWSQLNAMPADGSVLMGTNLPHIVMQPLQGSAGYETKDIETVYWFHYTPDAILVSNDSQFETLKDLIDFASDNPGVVTFSGSGTNTANHIAQVRFDQMAGIETTYIPFSGTAPAFAAVIGGQVMAEWGYTTVAAQQADSLRMLAVATEERVPLFPDVPTFKQLGFDLVSGAYRGIAVPKGTPDETKQQISDVIGKINQRPGFREEMEQAGFVVTDIPLGETDAFMADITAKLEAVADTLGVQN